ncbi:hypothetical protein ACS0TY_022207 [Phlomoides rotata]
MDQELQWDMISEVLIRTPLDTLDTCKKVCNGWKELIYDSTFFPFYLERRGTLFGFFVQDILKNEHVSEFVGVGEAGCCINQSWLQSGKIVASSNEGIVCCVRRRNREWWIGKPATEQWTEIPNPQLIGHETVGVAIIVSKLKPLRFKIVRLSEMEMDGFLDVEYACEIFDSKTWDWIRTRSVYLHYHESLDDFDQPAITVGEFVYWKTSSNNVLAFHASQGNFDKFPLPQTDGRLVEYQGGLGFCCSTPDGNVRLWLTSCRDNYEWRRKMDVNLRVVEQSFTHPRLVGFCNTSTPFVVAMDEAIFFDVEDESFTNKKIDFDLRSARQFFQFRSDVEPVEFRSSGSLN